MNISVADISADPIIGTPLVYVQCLYNILHLNTVSIYLPVETHEQHNDNMLLWMMLILLKMKILSLKMKTLLLKMKIICLMIL